MKNSGNILFIGGVLLIGVFFIALLLFFGGTGTQQSPALTASQAQSAANLNVSMPPEPLPPVSSSTKGVIPAATTLADVSNQTSAPAPASVADICTGSDAQNFQCYQDYYTKLIKSKAKIGDGIAAAFTDLKARYQNNAYVQSQCHPLTHVIGRVAAQSFTKVSAAYVYGDSFCWSGYYHGVLETFVGRVGRNNIDANINNICADLNTDGKYGFNYFNCVHGLGHGLMAITDDQLFQSLNYCSSLKGDWEQQSCAGGVYMENVIADGLNHVTNYLDPKRPLYPCSDSPDKYKNTCYLMQTSYMLKINSGDFNQTFAWCREAGDYKDTCFQSLGRDASGRSVSNGPTTKATCMLGANTEEVSNCAIGAVKDFISYFHSDVQGKALCALFGDPVKTTCLDTATSYYQSF